MGVQLLLGGGWKDGMKGEEEEEFTMMLSGVWPGRVLGQVGAVLMRDDGLVF